MAVENPNPPAEPGRRPAVQVFVATTVMLTFISFWRAAAIVLADLASSAYYVGGDTENVIGRSAPWFILGVMLFSYAVRALYIESSSMFVRGGVYRVVKEAMGSHLAKISVSALMFDYILTGPISAVAAGVYMAGFVQNLAAHFGYHILESTHSVNYFGAVFAVLVTLYFWRKNILGMHESSQKALRIMQITTVMVVMIIVWCFITLLKVGVHWPPAPVPGNMKLGRDTLGWLYGTRFSHFAPLLVMVGFGHSVLAMSGEETLAQVNREIESPKLKNLQKAGLIIFIYSLLFTSLVSFFAVMIIPDHARPQYFANLIGGLTVYLVGPVGLRLAMQAFVVLVGALILSGAVNTAIVGSNGVLNRVSEDGVMTDWFRHPHRQFGTTHRMINLIVGLQILTIVLSRGNVYLLAALYAFGVIWSFAFNALAVLVLRFTEPEGREWKVPGNLTVAGREYPIGVAVIGLILFAIAGVNLFTKPVATTAGLIVSGAFFILFTISERVTQRKQKFGNEHLDKFQVTGRADLAADGLRVRPGNVLVCVRDPHTLHQLRYALSRTDTTRQDVVVMTTRLYSIAHQDLDENQVFDHFEQELFTNIVAVAEKAGKPVSLLVVPGKDVFQSIIVTAQRLQSSTIVVGYSAKLSSEEQAKLTGDAWEGLPDPRPRLTLEVLQPDGSVQVYYLGPHTPRLRPEDLELLHNLWLEVTADQANRNLHHYDVVALALHELQDDLHSGRREAVIERLRALAQQQLPVTPEVESKAPAAK